MLFQIEWGKNFYTPCLKWDQIAFEYPKIWPHFKDQKSSKAAFSQNERMQDIPTEFWQLLSSITLPTIY